jgi:hypothetical protein
LLFAQNKLTLVYFATRLALSCPILPCPALYVCASVTLLFFPSRTASDPRPWIQTPLTSQKLPQISLVEHRVRYTSVDPDK